MPEKFPPDSNPVPDRDNDIQGPITFISQRMPQSRVGASAVQHGGRPYLRR